MPIRLPEMDPCYFCEVIGGRAPRWQVIEETPLTITLLNGRQYEVGQCMVVPTRHAPTILDLNADEEAAVMAAARRVAHALVTAFDPDGILLYQNNGVGSAQEVPHFHLHVVARQPGSDWGDGPAHLASVERRPPHLDFRMVTDAKIRTVEVLRRSM